MDKELNKLSKNYLQTQCDYLKSKDTTTELKMDEARQVLKLAILKKLVFVREKLNKLDHMDLYEILDDCVWGFDWKE